MSIKFEKLNNVTDKESLVKSFDEILIKLEHLVESLKVNNPKMIVECIVNGFP